MARAEKARAIFSKVNNLSRNARFAWQSRKYLKHWKYCTFCFSSFFLSIRYRLHDCCCPNRKSKAKPDKGSPLESMHDQITLDCVTRANSYIAFLHANDSGYSNELCYLAKLIKNNCRTQLTSKCVSAKLSLFSFPQGGQNKRVISTT